MHTHGAPPPSNEERVDVLVPISGGKDSQACLKLALQHHPRERVRGLFCDTSFEHPLTYQHVERMRELYGVRIDVVAAGTVEEQVLKHKRFPSDVARFCTEELKIWPTKDYCRELATTQGSRVGRKGRGKKKAAIEASQAGGFEVWYGMRAAESTAREKRYAGKVGDDVYPPHEVLRKYPQYLSKLGVMFRLAVLEWSDADVFDYLAGEENPLYRILDAQGRRKFNRVGCFPCQAAGDKPKEAAYQHDDFGAQQYRKVLWLSQQIGKPMFNSKGGQARDAARRAAAANDEFAGCAVCAI